MDSAVSLEEPHVLLDLPKAYSPSGRQWVGSSFNIFNRRRRRRADIVIAVDGHGLNLYASTEPRLLTSHALPPQSSLTAAPVFLHRRSVKGKSQPQRFACAAINPGSGHTKHQLCSFVEDVKLNTTDGAVSVHSATKQVLEFGSKEDPVIFIDALPASRTFEETGPPFDLITMSQSGLITCHTGDFSSEIWSDHVWPEEDQCTVDFAILQDAATLQEGFLGAHPDLIAKITPVIKDESSFLSETYLLLTVTSNKSIGRPPAKSFNMSLLRRSDAPKEQRFPVRSLASWPITYDAPNNQSAVFDFDCRTGHLQITYGGLLKIHDFSQLIPAEICKMQAQDGDFSSVKRMAGPLVLATGLRHLSVYDVRHKSLLARVETFRPTKQLKRKRSEPTSLSGPLRLIRYSRSSGVLYGLTDTQLVSVKVDLPIKRTIPGAFRPGRLADSLGRASSSTARDAPFENDQGLAQVLAQLSASLSDPQAFDKTFDEQVVQNHGLPVQAVSHISSYVLCKVFAWVGRDSKKKFDMQPSLRVARMPRETFHWLTFKGYVTPQNLEHVLCHNTAAGVSLPRISAHDLVEAIARYDQSLVLLSAWIELQPHPELDTYVQALQRLLQSFDSDESASETKMITDGKDADEVEDDEMLEDAESAAERDLNAASTLLEDGMQIRAGAIKTCLSRLTRSAPQSSLARSFRANMSQRDLILLIDLLRVELSEDGWMSRQLDAPAQDSANDIPSEGLLATCTLLNSAIDAMGSAGLLAGSYGIADEYSDAEDFLKSLRHEVSAIIEGIQEATFFSGFLKDFLRFENVSQPGDQGQVGRRISTGQGQDSALPQGVDSTKSVSATRIGAGGEIQKRSDRDIAHKISRRLGQYSFESIRV